jgi:hypothetical protein
MALNLMASSSALRLLAELPTFNRRQCCEKGKFLHSIGISKIIVLKDLSESVFFESTNSKKV